MQILLPPTLPQSKRTGKRERERKREGRGLEQCCLSWSLSVKEKEVEEKTSVTPSGQAGDDPENDSAKASKVSAQCVKHIFFIILMLY